MSRLHALILSAGLGTRLRPLTHFLPKPLLPVCGEPVVARTLASLVAMGCDAVALNVHYRPHEIQSTIGDSYREKDVVYSTEDKIQGSLGALFPLRAFLAEAEQVLIINGDTFCNWPFEALVRQHRRNDADVTLLLHRRADPASFGGGVGIDERSSVTQLRGSPAAGSVQHRRVFAGAHVLSRRFLQQEVFEKHEPGHSDLVGDLYIPFLAAGGRIESFQTSARWHDLGTPSRYLEACLDQARGPRPLRRPASSLAPDAEIHAESEVRHSAIESGVKVEKGATIQSSLVLPGAVIAAGSRIRRSIIGPGVRPARALDIEGRMICRATAGYQPESGDSVLGDLIYTPL